MPAGFGERVTALSKNPKPPKPQTRRIDARGEAGFSGGFPIRSLACIELALRKDWLRAFGFLVWSLGEGLEGFRHAEFEL